MSKDAVARAFTLAKGKAGVGRRRTTDTHRLPSDRDHARTPADQGAAHTIAYQLKNEFADEVLSEYVAALEDRLGTHMNPEEFKETTGSGTATE